MNLHQVFPLFTNGKNKQPFFLFLRGGGGGEAVGYMAKLIAKQPCETNT
jgi:hypothetical protein